LEGEVLACNATIVPTLERISFTSSMGKTCEREWWREWTQTVEENRRSLIKKKGKAAVNYPGGKSTRVRRGVFFHTKGRSRDGRRQNPPSSDGTRLRPHVGSRTRESERKLNASEGWECVLVRDLNCPGGDPPKEIKDVLVYASPNQDGLRNFMLGGALQV